MAIRSLGLGRAIRGLGLGDDPVPLRLWGYSEGSRATLEARVGGQRIALKCYAEDPGEEAALYDTLAAEFAKRDLGVRVPRLLAWDRELRVLAISWLEGPTAQEIMAAGRGERVGELAAHWIRCAARLQVTLGSPVGAAEILYRARRWAVTLGDADGALGPCAAALT